MAQGFSSLEGVGIDVELLEIKDRFYYGVYRSIRVLADRAPLSKGCHCCRVGEGLCAPVQFLSFQAQ